jgi:hypothetical protein
MLVRIKSKNLRKDAYYNVNLEELTCTCKDWSCRRHNFPKDDNKRLCKHLSEALELNSLVSSKKCLQLTESPILIDKSEVLRISDKLRSEDIILRYLVCGEYYMNHKYLTEYLPIVVRLTHNSVPYSEIDRIMSQLGYRLTCTENDLKRYYSGKMPVLISISNDNFPFQSIFYDTTRDNFLRLSSISVSELGLKLTENGFIDSNNIKIDIDVSTEEEIMELLKIDKLV